MRRGASLVITGGRVDDTLIVDFSHGNPVPRGGLTFNGGGHVSRAGNLLFLRGGSFHRVVYDYVNAHDGSVEADGARIRYTGLQPVVNSGTAADVVFNLPAGSYNAFLEDDGTPGNNMSQLRSSTGAFETTSFTNPTSSLTINAGSGQTVSVNPVDSFGSANLTVSGPDSITVGQFATTGTTTLAPTGSISEASPGALVTGSLVTSGAGPVALTGLSNVVGTVASSASGAFSLVDGASSGLTVGSVGGVDGIASSGGSISVTTSGALLTVSKPVASGGGVVSLLADGMSLSGGSVSAGSGVVELQPYSAGRGIDLGTNPSAGKLGLSNADLAVITAGVVRVGDLSTTGSVSVTAPISAPAGWSALSLLTEIGGTISQGLGDSLSVPALNAAGYSSVSLTASSNVVGTVAGASTGAWSLVDSTDATVGSVDPGLGFGFGVGIIDSSGAVSLTVNGSHSLSLAAGIDTTHTFGGPSPGGPVTLTADSMSLSGGSVNAGSAVVELQPDSSGRAIDLGTNPSAGKLGLSNADLAVITAGVVRVGDLFTTGNITLTAAITAPAGWSKLSLLTGIGGTISQAAGASLNVPALNAAAQASVTLTAAGNAVATVAGASQGPWSLVDSTDATVASVDPGLGFGFGVGVIGGGPVTLTVTGSHLTLSNAINTTFFGGGGSDVSLTAPTINIAATVTVGAHRLNVTGETSFGPAATFNVVANGVGTPGVAYTEMAAASGGVQLGNAALALTVDYSPALGDTLTIASDPSGAITGTFNGLPDGSTLTAGGVLWQIHYTAHTITLTAVQAPAITSANNTTFTIGTNGSFAITSTGSPTPAISEVGALPSGVTITDNGNGTATLSGKPALGSVGSYPITVTANNGVSPNATQSFTLTVAKAETQTNAVTSSVNPSLLSQQITFTTKVAAKAPATGTPTGTVDFYDGTTKIGSGTLNNAGTATFTTSSLAVGSHSITAVYEGDSNFKGSDSSTAPLVQKVSYGIKLLYDPSKPSTTGSTVPIKVSLQDFLGHNVSTPSIVLTVTGVTPSPGVAQPSGPFMFTSPTYQYNLKTTGYAKGSYNLTFTAGADPITHQAPFIIR
jgi:hypothetical protein